MKTISHLLMVLLALVLSLSLAASVINGSLWSGPYLLDAADKSHLAAELAATLPEAVSAAVGGNQADTKTVLKLVITPAYIQNQLESLVPQLEDYYQNGGPAPTLDLRDLATRIHSQSLPVPAALATSLDAPITVAVPNAPALTNLAHQSHQVVWLGPLVALVLAGLIFVTARKRRWFVLAGAAIGAAIGAGVLAGIATLPPRLIASSLDTSSIHAITPAVRHLAEIVASDQTHSFLVAALVLLAAGVALGATHVVTALLHRFKRPKAAH